MARRDIVVMGGSTGAADVLRQVLPALPPDLPASVFVVTHVPANGVKILGQALAGICRLPVSYAEDGAAVAPSRIYIAQPDRHLLIVDGVIRLGSGSKERMARPAIDALFRSAALTFGPRVIGVVLSGMLNDGAAGLNAIKRCGGAAVVQAPHTARSPDMPIAALQQTEVDHIVGVNDLAGALIDLIGVDVDEPVDCPQDLSLDVEIALGERLAGKMRQGGEELGVVTCPTCRSVLSQPVDGRIQLQEHSQIGVVEKVMGVPRHTVEQALRIALRLVEERVELVDRLGREAKKAGRDGLADMYRRRTREYSGYADTLRQASIGRLPVAGVGESD
ncbi:MAG: chemotaxis protein CheB [Caulobacteraceae bacterium]